MKFSIMRKHPIHVNEVVNSTNNKHLYLFKKYYYSNQTLIASMFYKIGLMSFETIATDGNEEVLWGIYIHKL